MEKERSHRNSNTSELFICLASGLSSSSMKISSKSILSPGRAIEPSQISLTSSLSRRLKSSGSIKRGQASPMFPTSGKKRGALENPEPSSPKVTCIGQVRVKTKKQGMKMRTGSQRRVEASCRKTEQNLQPIVGQEHHQVQSFQFQNPQHECLPQRNQKWVHLPLTICEALKAFGAEFNCFLPCRPSCMTTEKEKKDIGVRSENGSSCGSGFARWLVALQDGDGKGREIELVIEGEERTEKSTRQRRQMFEGIEFKEEYMENGHEDEARQSMCIPPKNALLLMRCRSDPVKTSDLAYRIWKAPPNENDNEEDEEKEDDKPFERDMEEGEDRQVKVDVAVTELGKSEEMCEKCELFSDEEHEHSDELSNLILQEEKKDMVEENVIQEIENPERCIEIDGLLEESEDPKQVGEREKEHREEKQEFEVDSEAGLAQESDTTDTFLKTVVNNSEKIEEKANKSQLLHENVNTKEPPLQKQREVEEKVESRASSDSSSSTSVHSEEESVEEKCVDDEKKKEETQEPLSIQKRAEPENENENRNTQEVQVDPKSKVEKERSVLPDCLLLMMCEPKLSMEVSKETWVCNTDFIRWLPDRDRNRRVNKIDGSDEPKKTISFSKRKASKPTQTVQRKMQPPRSSCSLPPGSSSSSMDSMIEQKLVDSISKAYEPFVLTRCKSEPRSSATMLAPDACFWNNRKLELHRPATVGVGAAGIGF